MGVDGKWIEKLQRKMETGLEAVPMMPLVEISGRSRVLIENHRGVCCYGSEKIRVRVSYGEVDVSGAELEVARMSREQLVITGKIRCVLLQGREET